MKFTKILLLSETLRRWTCLIGDLNMLHRKPSCLIRDPSETSICYIVDRHAGLETHRRQPCLRDTSETSTCFIGDPSETDMHQYIIPLYINKQKVFKNSNI